MKMPRLWPRPVFRLTITFRSGATLVGYVNEYTVRHTGSGVSAINWSQSRRCQRLGPVLVHVGLEDVVAVDSKRV